MNNDMKTKIGQCFDGWSQCTDAEIEQFIERLKAVLLDRKPDEQDVTPKKQFNSKVRT